MGATHAERERVLRERIVAIAEAELPDDIGLEWIVHGFDHQAQRSWVEAEPRPATVGYPRFRFLVSFADPDRPETIATYCLTRGRFALLSSARDAGDLPRQLP